MNQTINNNAEHTTSLNKNRSFGVYFASLIAFVLVISLFVYLWPKSNQPLAMIQQSIKIPEHPLDKSLITSGKPHNYSISYTIHDGDNLSDVLANYGISTSTLDRIMKLGELVKPLRKLVLGHVIEIQQTDETPLQLLTYHYEYDKDLIIKKTENGFEATVKVLPIIRRNIMHQATISYSLFSACQHAGIPANLVQEFINKFAWDIDFAKDIREGDKVSMVYEELFNGDKKVGTGHLLAAAFINHGKTYSLFRFTMDGETDYYTGDGRSVRKRFLRAPVKFSHISSLFNLTRMHPILHRIRAHQGVDYAAPYGTPIHATGDGKIVFHGQKGGYGNAIIIDHGSDYSTLYGHMSRFANKPLGSHVKQGELIGYVGATGLATANHVHYEFRIHEIHFDPLKIKLPKSNPIAQKYRNEFFARAHQFSVAMGLPTEVVG